MLTTVQTPHSAPTPNPGSSEAVAPVPRLTHLGGPRAGESYLLDRDVVVIGRGANTNAFDVVVDDPAVSRPHAQVVREGETFILHDLGSANGTSLNYRRLTEAHALEDGDLIQVGRTVLVFRTPAGIAGVPIGAAPVVQTHNAQVVTFFRLKGGVGNTMLAVNTALRLRALTEAPTLLVDLSTEQPCAAVHLDVPSRGSLDTLARLSTAAPEVLQQIVVRHDSGLDVLPAPVLPETAELITGELLSTVLPVLKTRYRWIVVDTAPAFSELNLTLLDETHSLVVVTTPDIPTLKMTQTCLDVCARVIRGSCERRLVLNNVHAHPRLEHGDFAEMLGERIDHQVPYSEDVLRSIDRGLPLALTTPEHPVIQALDGVVSQLAQVEAPTVQLSARGRFWPRSKGLLRR